MKNRYRVVPLSILLITSAGLSCTSRSPVSQAKDRAPRFSRAGGPSVATGVRASNGVTNRELHGAAGVAAPAEVGSTLNGPIVGHAVGYALTAPVRDLPSTTAEADPSVSQPGREINERNDEEVKQWASVPSGGSARPNGMQVSAPAINAIPGPSLTFEGNSAANNTAFFGTTVAPPDTNGAVGPNHYVQITNLLVGVYNKTTGALVGGRFKLSSLFAPLGGVCATNDNGDPVANYDKLADRWVLSQFAFADFNHPPYHQCIAVSINGDPTGSYYAYDFITPGGNFPDYPKVATWPDAYYMTDHQFDHGGPFNGSGVFAFDRKKMLVGDPTATLIYFNLDLASHPEGIFGILASDFDGIGLPPAGAPNVFAYPTAVVFGDPSDALRLFDFHADFGTPASSTFTERAESPLPVAAWDLRDPPTRADIPQPPPAGAADYLDTVGSRLMYRMQYQNRGGTETLVSNITVNTSGVAPTSPANFHAGVRYFELQRTSPGSPFAINEQGTQAPDSDYRWRGSVAEDNSGDLAVGYSVSSTTTFPSLRYAGRLPSDPPGSLAQGEATLFAGTAVQGDTVNRWGDYSAMQIDPTDFCTFWFTSEYYNVNSTFNWRTRIGAFKFPSCVSPAMGKITGTVKDCVTNLPIVGAIVQASDGHSAATGAGGTYSITVPPGSYTVTASDPFRNCNPSSSQSVSVSNGGSSTANFCLTGHSKLDLGAVTTDDSLGNNNGFVNRDECVRLTIGLKNDGCIADSGISGTLSTSTPGVTINQALSTYPNLVVDTSGNNATPYAFTTSPTYDCGTPIDFTLTVSSDKQPTHALHFSVPTCGGGASMPFSGTIQSGDAATVSGRLGRNGIASGCDPQKGCPGTLGTGPRRFDSFAFANSASAPACLHVNLNSACGTSILGVAYLDSFDPANQCTNYIGDAGGSAASVSFSAPVPGGHSLVLVVEEVVAGIPDCAYSGTVSGFYDFTTDGGACPACVVSSSLTKTSLWPANHNLINVGLSASTTGVCPAVNSVSVFSDEDDVDPQTIGDMSPDAKNIALSTLRLRAERRDSGDGRVYLVVTRASDGTGNGGFSCKTVVVPKSQSAGDINSVNAQAAAAQTFCTNNAGSAPAGFFVVGDGPVIGPKQERFLGTLRWSVPCFFEGPVPRGIGPFFSRFVPRGTYGRGRPCRARRRRSRRIFRTPRGAPRA